LFKFKPIQIKIANLFKKPKNHAKSNMFLRV